MMIADSPPLIFGAMAWIWLRIVFASGGALSVLPAGARSRLERARRGKSSPFVMREISDEFAPKAVMVREPRWGGSLRCEGRCCRWPYLVSCAAIQLRTSPRIIKLVNSARLCGWALVIGNAQPSWALESNCGMMCRVSGCAACILPA
jgi:hypothetical protein